MRFIFIHNIHIESNQMSNFFNKRLSFWLLKKKKGTKLVSIPHFGSQIFLAEGFPVQTRYRQEGV